MSNLSFKKGSQVSSASASPVMSKKESRRKALQEFYNLQKEKEAISVEDNKSTQIYDTSDTINETGDPSLETPEELQNYIQTSSIEDILKFKKSMVNKYNSNSLVKKSIIYDNYYELIKLNQTLDTLSKPTPSPKVSGLGIIGLDEPTIDATYFDNILNDLNEFIKNESGAFNQPFEEVVRKLR